MARRARRPALPLLAGAPLAGILLLAVGGPAVAPASAHGFSSVVYAEVSSGGDGGVRTELQLEYDLLVVSAADAGSDDALFEDGTAAFEGGDDADRSAALEEHSDSVLAYVADRFGVASGGEACTPELVDPIGMTEQQGAPYAVITLDHACPADGDAHTVESRLFGDDEGYVTATKTILTYGIDGRSGSAALDAETPSFSTAQSTAARFWEFLHLGAEHLLTGLDHILFLLALIAGSRRLREVVLTATAFTVAHSVTFILAATGAVSVPVEIVEPVIALSIAVVAAWHLWRLWRRGAAADSFDGAPGRLGLDRVGWTRLAVVLLFGLVHGLGFASALGIDEPWSWTLLWSLLVFNLGIELVQLAIVAVVFPLLALLRRRTPRLGHWVTGAVAVVVTAAGLVWFVERILGF